MATIAEKSRTKEIIDRLQVILDTAPSVPLAAGKISIYKDEVQSLLSELASQIEIELKTYHEVNDRKGKIISEAKKEAEKIIYQAEHTASRVRVTKRTTGVAPLDYSVLDEDEIGALDNANEIYAASLIYTDEMLTEVTDLISDAYHNIRNDYEIILRSLEDKLNIIVNNRAELMDGLQEMDREDRSQQILEIGQLLSNELYTSRMKAKMNLDEYDAEAVQTGMKLQEEQEEKTRQAEEKAQYAEAVAQHAETVAQHATAKAQYAEAELARMMAERDALVQKVDQLKKESIRLNVELEAKTALQSNKEEEEYEIVYVTEDELEEGEEYEIEYVDEDDNEIESVQAVYKKEDVQTEKSDANEYVSGGFIERAIKRREMQDLNDTVKMVEEIQESQDVKSSWKMQNSKSEEQKTVTESEKRNGNLSENPVTKIEEEKLDEKLDLKLKAKKNPNEKTDMKLEAEEKPNEKTDMKLKEEERTNEKMGMKLKAEEKPNEKTDMELKAEEKPNEKTDMELKEEERPNEKTGMKLKAEEKTDENRDVKLKEKKLSDKKQASNTNEKKQEQTKVKTQDEDIRTDGKGRRYVQATMMFDEKFEITEF